MAALAGASTRLGPQLRWRSLRTRPAVPAAGQQARRRGARVAGAKSQAPEPDFDDLVLDEQYYRDLGITPEELEEQRAMTSAYGADPEGFDIDFDTASSLSEDMPEEMRAAILSKNVYGPPVSSARSPRRHAA